MATTQDITAIKGYIEKYDRTLIMQMLNGLDFIRDLNAGLRRNVRTKISLPKLVVDEGIRPLNTEIEQAKGKRTWTKRTLEPRHFMKIFKVIIHDAKESFMSEMLAPNAKREAFAAWQWAREFEKVAEELNNNFYLAKYHGDPDEWTAAGAQTYTVGDLVYFDKNDGRGLIIYECVTNAANAESPTTHPAKWTDVDNKVLFDGPGTLIADLLTASTISAFAGGSYDDTTAYDAFKAQWDDIPEAHKGKGITAFASVNAVEDLMAHQNSKFGSGKGIGGVDVDIAAGGSFIMKNTAGRLRIKPCTWMGTSRRIIMTLPQNFVTGIDAVSDMNSVGKIVETLHGYNSVMKGMLTFNFADTEVLYVNNQA